MSLRRPRGAGSIRKVGDCYFFRISYNGVRKSFPLRDAKTDDDAQREADALIDRFRLLKCVETKDQLAMFVGSSKKLVDDPRFLNIAGAFERFMGHSSFVDCSKSLLKVKAAVWRDFEAFCSDRLIFKCQDITTDDLRQFRDSLAETRKPKTCNMYIQYVRQVLYSQGVPKDRFNDLRQLRFRSEPMQFFTAEELKSVFDSIDGKMDLSVPFRDEMKVLFRILAWTGLRLKDACLLTWDSVDLRQNLIRVMPFKTRLSSGSCVMIPLHNDVRQMLEDCFEKRKMGIKFVLPGVAKRYSSNSSCIQHEIARTIDWTFWENPQKGRRPPKAGRFGAHSFRHTFATFLINAGVHPEVIMKLLGQTSLSITRIYTHLSQETAKSVIAALPQ